MSTNFLNRRMDLKHIYGKHFINNNIFEMVNMLKMDTSYPVKLSGKIIKLFTAAVPYPFYKHNGSDNFAGDDWLLINTEDEVILRVKFENVYDFAGRRIDNNIGEKKAYPATKDVFNEGDYVMVIIDFDNATIHLCSESNFKNFIVGPGADGNVKLFDITGDTINGGGNITDPFDLDVFAEAVEFEADNEDKDVTDRRYSLMRNDVDNVVYEIPVIEDPQATYMTPVANVYNEDINSLNNAIINFTFPHTNCFNVYKGIDTIDSFQTYSSIEGSTNEKFINEFVLSYDEFINNPIFGKNYINRFYDTLDEEHRQKYGYVITAKGLNNDNDSFDDVGYQHLNAIPFDIENKKFMVLPYLDNNAIKCNGEWVNIKANGTVFDNMQGTYWTDDTISGFHVYNYNGDYAHLIIQDASNEIFDSNNSTWSSYSNTASDRVVKTIIVSNSQYVNSNFTPKDYFSIDNNLKYIKRFIEFFGNNDSNYIATMKRNALGQVNNTKSGSVTFRFNNNHNAPFDNSPVCVVAMYPELFEHILFDESDGQFIDSSNIHTFTGFNPEESHDSFDRTKYKFRERISIYNWDNAENRILAYELLNRYCGRNNSPFTMNTSFKFNDATKLRCNINGVGYDYKCRPSQSIISGDNGILIIDNTNNVKYLCTLVNKIRVAKIDTPYIKKGETAPDYNNVELATQALLITRKIHYAGDHIGDRADEFFIEIDGVEYPLYTIQKNNNDIIVTKLTKSNFKLNSLCPIGIDYYYFIKDNVLYRIKYCYKYDDYTFDNVVAPYDYFTDKVKLLDLSGINNNDDKTFFNNAWLYYYASQTSSSESDAIARYNSIVSSNNGWMTIVKDVVTGYKFHPFSVDYPEGSNGVTDETKYVRYDTSFGNSTTVNLAEVDYRVDCAVSRDLDKIKELREYIGSNDYAVEMNCMAPYVSDTKINGIFDYSVDSYNKWLKNRKVKDCFDTAIFKYINGCGIRDEYYVNKSIYEFYHYLLTRDIGKDFYSDESYLPTSCNRTIYSKEQILKIKGFNSDGKFIDENNNKVTVYSSMYLKSDMDKKNIFSYNRFSLVKPIRADKDNPEKITANEDVTENYKSDDAINITITKTGDKSVYGVSITDNEPLNPVLLSINGNISDIDVDKINWNTMLLALNNNKTIDILSDSLINIKQDLNKYFDDSGQNINSKVDINDSITQDDANKHDANMFPESSKNYHDHNAEYDSKHNIYNFYYGYGYPNTSTTNNTRVLNNRGVIVFETEGFSSIQRRDGNTDPEKFTYTLERGTVYPSRMYINNDGLLCTKEFFEREVNTYKPSGSDTPSYPTPTCIAELIYRIEQLERRVSELEHNG